MTSRPVPNELLAWAVSAAGASPDGERPEISRVAGDASNRRYFRLVMGERTYIVVEAPPATENNPAFLAVREMLASAGVRVPGLYAADLEAGYMLLEDLGDRMLLAELNSRSVDGYYHNAFELLQQLAVAAPATGRLPVYNEALLQEELGRFSAWFVEALLGYSPGLDERDLLARLDRKLIDSALEQPRVLVHRDFHSRNLMLPGDGQLAVIDFQDAVVGPISYDPVSLLRDCYIRWPQAKVEAWALEYRDRLQASGLLSKEDASRFLRWFDWMGLQRHIKVLGTFARLYLRDHKSAYLEDLPLVNAYVLEIVDKYASQEPVFAAFSDWYRSALSPLIARQDWGSCL